MVVTHTRQISCLWILSSEASTNETCPDVRQILMSVLFCAQEDDERAVEEIRQKALEEREKLGS